MILRRHLLSDDPLAKEVALIGYAETRQLLCFAIPLIAGVARGSAQSAPDAFTNLPLIHGWPSEAWDKYTREGCSAYRHVLKHHPSLREKLERWIEPGKVKEAFGYIMFAVESGKLDRRLSYPGSGEILALGQQADVCRFGVPIGAVDEVMRVVGEALRHGVWWLGFLPIIPHYGR